MSFNICTDSSKLPLLTGYKTNPNTPKVFPRLLFCESGFWPTPDPSQTLLQVTLLMVENLNQNGWY